MPQPRRISTESLKIDCEAESIRISQAIRGQVTHVLRRRGVVVGLSGGIDSSVVAALCAHALGKERVLGILMPEIESASESTTLGSLVAESLSIPYVREDITPLLRSVRCYERRNDAIRTLFPDFSERHRCKIVLPSVIDDDRFRVFSLVIQSPDGRVTKVRMPPDVYETVVASNNFKQRARKMIEYFHADRLHYAVAGTPNRLEYDQGFFVKNGDGAADLKPIAHLYKTQVYELAAFLEIPGEILRRPPTTDTYSMPQSQEEFFFSLPYGHMDLCLYAYNHGIEPEEVGPAVGLTTTQVKRVYRDIESKRRAAQYGHLPPLLVEDVLSKP